MHRRVTLRLLCFGMLAFLFAASGCSGDDAASEVLPSTVTPSAVPVDPVETPTVAPQVEPTMAPTIAPTPVPTATIAPTATAIATATAVPEPTPTLEPLSDEEFEVAFQQALAERDIIEEVHTRVMTELFARDERSADAAGNFRRTANEVATAGFRDDLLSALDQRQLDREFVVSTGYDSNIEAVEVLPDGRVQVCDCSRDNSRLLNEGGSELAVAGNDWTLRWTILSDRGDGWFVEEYRAGGVEPCDPNL